MGRLTGRGWAIASCTLLGIATGARGEYAVVDLGALTNAGTQKNAAVGQVNAMTQVSMTLSSDGLVYHGMRFQNGSLTDLGTLGGANSYAGGINASGQIVGRSQTVGGVVHSFLWTPGGAGGVAGNPQMKDLNPTGGVSQASAINASGQVVGFVTVSRPGQLDADRAYIYSGGALTQIPLPVGGYTYSYAYGVNDAGKVVGEAYTALSPFAQGFFYNGSTTVEIGNLGGGSSTPLAINKNDRAVGYSATVDGYDHAFSYVGGTMTDLGTLGGHYSYANALNNADQIVGGAFVDDLDTVYHAFSSDGSVMTDLNGKITSKAAGWVLNEASSVNDAGVIVGTGTLSGVRHGFMLRPLVPGDANADGTVNFNDLVTLAQNYNSPDPADWEHGDFTGDGKVDFNDLVGLAQNYNTVQFGSAASFAADLQAAFAAVPEPNAAAVTVTAGMVIGGVGRRRRRSEL